MLSWSDPGNARQCLAFDGVEDVGAVVGAALGFQLPAVGDSIAYVQRIDRFDQADPVTDVDVRGQVSSDDQ